MNESISEYIDGSADANTWDLAALEGGAYLQSGDVVNSDGPLGRKETEHRMSKHLDLSRGQYYYFDRETEMTTWDAPLEHVPLYFSEEQIALMTKAHESTLKSKALESTKRLEIIETMMEDRQLAKAKEDADMISRRNRDSVNCWEAGMLIAVNENNDCNMSWKDIPRIEPILYEYEMRYGFRLRALRLVGIKLTEVPDELGRNLQGLEVLNLSNNQLRTLPDSIVYLTSLTQLTVLHNKLETLPQRIGLMCNLRRLEVANNELVALPDTFAALTHIKQLDLEANRLRLLPENLDLMSHLQVLNVNKNRLLRLPRCLSSMKGLKLISANKNEISYIPNDLVKSTSIEIIRLCNNELTMLPERLGELISLKELALDFNHLSFLPMTFYMLENLSHLRLEGNPALCSPGDEVITAGAKSVVAWCRDRFLDDQQARMRRIIFTVQDTFRQLHERGLADLTKFDNNFYWKEDLCYAFKFDYLFETVVPLMNKTWEREASRTRGRRRRDSLIKDEGSSFSGALVVRGGTDNARIGKGSPEKPTKVRDMQDDTIITTFPFTKAEVMWAFTHYFDANGAVYSQGRVFFKRCGCRDANGRRLPCVPPKKGYMCNTKAFVLKQHIVLKKERERRLWEKMKKAAILEAGLRAEQEAVQWLESDAGALWVAEMSYERGEHSVEEKGLDSIVQRRRQQCEKKKDKIIEKFEGKKNKIKKILDQKTNAIETQLHSAKELLKTAKEGYIKEATTTRIHMLSEQLTQFEEHQQLLDLQDECSMRCQEIEDEYFKGSSSDEDDDSVEENGIDFYETPEEKVDRLAREEREIKAAAIRNAGVEGGGTKADREAQQVEERRLRREAQEKKKQLKKLKRQKKFKRLKRQYKYVVDRFHLKYSHLKLILNGEFSEAQQELQHHIFQEYIKNSVAKARRAAEREYFVMDKIRRQWGGLGMETSFYQWKDYVKSVKSARRKDLRRKWRQEIKNFESAMICVHLAQAQIDFWKKSTDVYTDTPYWRNWDSGAISWEEPKLETYMPLGFKFPDPPVPLPPDVGENTTDDSSDGNNDDENIPDFLDLVKGSKDQNNSSLASTAPDALKGRGSRLGTREGSRRSKRRPRTRGASGAEEVNGAEEGEARQKVDVSDVWFNDETKRGGEVSSDSEERSISGSSAAEEESKSASDDEGDEKVDDAEQESFGGMDSGQIDELKDQSKNGLPLLLRVDSNVSSILDAEDEAKDAYASIQFPDDAVKSLVTGSEQDSTLTKSTGIGMDGNFQPRRWLIGGSAKHSLEKSIKLGIARTESLPNESPKRVKFSPFNSIDDSDFMSNPKCPDGENDVAPSRIVIEPANRLGIKMLPGAGRQQIITDTFSYGPDSLRVGTIPGRVGRSMFQVEISETDEEKKRRMMKERTEAVARSVASTASLLSTLSNPNKQKEQNAFSAGNAQEMLDALEGGSDISETAARARLAEIKADIRRKHDYEADRAKIALQGKEKDANGIRHQTYMKQRNRRPRLAQGMFKPRVKKEKEQKYYEPKSTFELLELAGGNYQMTRNSPMEVMSALAVRALKIKAKLREEAEAENLVPKKEKKFYHEHLDVIVRENYISSDSEEEELARQVKQARMKTAERLTTSRSRVGTAASTSAPISDGTTKLPPLPSSISAK